MFENQRIENMPFVVMKTCFPFAVSFFHLLFLPNFRSTIQLSGWGMIIFGFPLIQRSYVCAMKLGTARRVTAVATVDIVIHCSWPRRENSVWLWHDIGTRKSMLPSAAKWMLNLTAREQKNSVNKNNASHQHRKGNSYWNWNERRAHK